MNSREIRERFISFFAERGHRHIPSSSLIPPPEERTMLFTTAGMVQMKPFFMGLATPPATRLTTVQKVFRTSDIEEVGDNRHCTFFEMLGNFSVGDYFKPEIIPWALELLTEPPPQGLGLDKDRIWVTIYEKDEEAYDLWRSVGIPDARIVRNPERDAKGSQLNYWFMGAVGPCGPNTEINYDFGPYEGWEPHDCDPQCEVPGCRRFLELWNLVFMAEYQDEDGSRRPLPQRNVDTGGGLERWPVPVMWQNQVDWRGNPKQWQQPPTIFDGDLFQPILTKVGELAGRSYYEEAGQEQRSMRVVAEHARAATFLIADGVMPSNDGRGYVLRRLIRRGTSFGQRLSPGHSFLGETAESVIDVLGRDHESLTAQREFILRTLRSEETRFQETVQYGRNQLDELMRQHAEKQIPGRDVFQLWDTHGFPPELTQELLREEGYSVADPESFETLMQEQRERSRAATRFEGDAERIQTYVELALAHTEFVGYEQTRAYTTVMAIVLDGSESVQTLTKESSEGRRVEVVLGKTPFYAEGGGQVGDRGEIVWHGNPLIDEGHGQFIVEDTQAVGEGGVATHLGHLAAGQLSVGDAVEARVDEETRGDTMRNHTATHILHAALRQTLGTHVRQAGSYVSQDRLRFDFTHLEALSTDQLRSVEALANRAVRDNIPVHVEHMSYEQALEHGALAFFGDKYADTVRVVEVCDPHADQCFSKELCGGTHVHASGQVGSIIITAETSIGAGLRRLEALTGRAAAERMRQQEETVGRVSAMLRVPPAEVETRVTGLRSRVEELEKQLQATERRLARAEAQAASGGTTAASAEGAFEAGGVLCVVRRVDAPSADYLKDLGDALKLQSSPGGTIVLLGANIDGKPSFLAMATGEAAKRCPAGDIVRTVSREAGGGGGGRPELAQGGGTDPSKLDAALAAGRRLIEEKLGAVRESDASPRGS